MRKLPTHTTAAFSLTLAFMMTGTAAFSEILVGGFSSTGAGERIERVTGNTPPVWTESEGAWIEITGRYVATGDASVILRLADENRPLSLVWSSLDGWQLLKPGALPQDLMEGGCPHPPQTDVTWRLIIRGLKRPQQRVRLETLQAEKFQPLVEKDVQVRGLQEWISEKDGVLVFGLAGGVLLADVSVKIIKERTLFLVK